MWSFTAFAKLGVSRLELGYFMHLLARLWYLAWVVILCNQVGYLAALGQVCFSAYFLAGGPVAGTGGHLQLLLNWEFPAGTGLFYASVGKVMVSCMGYNFMQPSGILSCTGTGLLFSLFLSRGSRCWDRWSFTAFAKLGVSS